MIIVESKMKFYFGIFTRNKNFGDSSDSYLEVIRYPRVRWKIFLSYQSSEVHIFIIQKLLLYRLFKKYI